MRSYSSNEKKHFEVGQSVWISRDAMVTDERGRVRISRIAIDEILMRVTSLDMHVPIFLSSDNVKCKVVLIPDRNSVLINVETANVPIFPYFLMNEEQWNSERGIRLSTSLGI